MAEIAYRCIGCREKYKYAGRRGKYRSRGLLLFSEAADESIPHNEARCRNEILIQPISNPKNRHALAALSLREQPFFYHLTMTTLRRAKARSACRNGS